MPTKESKAVLSLTKAEKYEKLRAIFAGMESVVIAYSGGVDSSFLAAAAWDALKDNGGRVLAVTARSSTYPESEFRQALDIIKRIGAPHRVIVSEELDIPGYADNPPNRCFFCKGELFGILSKMAKEEGYAFVCDGANMDDLGDYRPGRKAAAEQGVRSPLIEAGFTKEDIRHHAQRLGLPNWDKPAAACLASRFPYGVKITAEKLSRVEQAEDILKKAGYRQLRVRDHDGIARIEIAKSELAAFMGDPRYGEWAAAIKALGFTYVTLDLEGYRTGSLNLSQ
ncbi:MAG: ATP-dependent sacrificial sulfur transferase LarE [Nitrospinae bacterium]|nr:ATP-dependent sacrificial sulfur transferase LarE [Nitrospinota bacterium]